MTIILLTVVLIIGHGKEDIIQSRIMNNLTECFMAAQAWDEQDIDMAGGTGFASGCSINEPEHRKARVEE